MKIDKQALRISELEELNELLREKVKKLESDLWDKEQLRQVYSEKSFNLDSKVRELEARNQKDFVWRGNEISRLNDEVDELKEKLEAAEQANKLAQEATENLVQERNALAAENTALKKSEVEFNEYCRRECEDVGDTWVDDFTETPATDAFLAEVRAQGVKMFADKYRAQLTALPTTSENIFDAAHVSLRYQIFDADEFAAQLRKGAAL